MGYTMQRVHALILPGLLSLLGLLITGCDRQPAKSNASHAKPRIVCTVAMIADLTQRIAGESADVVSLMGSGVDPAVAAPRSITSGAGDNCVWRPGITGSNLRFIEPPKRPDAGLQRA